MCGKPQRFLLTLLLTTSFLLSFTSIANAQRQQYKIEPNGTVLKLKRLDLTTFKYVPFAQAQLRRDGDGNAIWYFKADTGKEFTVPAINQPAAPTRYTAAQLKAALASANMRGEIPTAVRVEQVRGAPTFLVKFEKNSLDLRWHAQVGMSAQEYEIVNRTLLQPGYRAIFAEPYVNSERATRFVAGWRR